VIQPQADTATKQESWPRFFDAGIIEDGKALAVLVREFDGTISAVRIGIEQLAD
jgi:hypothetical protein